VYVLFLTIECYRYADKNRIVGFPNISTLLNLENLCVCVLSYRPLIDNLTNAGYFQYYRWLESNPLQSSIPAYIGELKALKVLFVIPLSVSGFGNNLVPSTNISFVPF
jgi:hypothetical protein